MAISDAKKRANKKWDAANMTNLAIKIRKDYAERIKAVCAANGTTPSAVMRSAIDSFMAEHNSETEQ